MTGRRTIANALLAIVASILVILVVAVPLDLRSQWVFAFVTVAGAIWLASRQNAKALLTLGLLSIVVSTRYIFWRTTQTLDFESVTGAVLGGTLYAAELYAYLILVLGFLQTAYPLDRPIVSMRGEPEDWPTVDIFVPTYNEDLDIVRNTVFAAMDIDYPADRFRVYILDDGRRPEFQAFAREAGCGYLTRADNKHAKAGNLNMAMRKTEGELIAIFDCDHVPTRAFLQTTLGWFQRDAKLALLQTPHHFYSPDPVQRNLQTVEDLPGEGDLFYGPVQKGNDLWNAAFFCGSCAVIRRDALMQTNGFAGETVTEDAHTALKLQRMGWNTAYIDTRLSAGLATERLALHVGQRIRWARGMTQIMRIDNPLTGRGLNLRQRLCYLNAMLHFQFPVPRIVFLISPLAYLFFGENVIEASASLIFAYALPHLYCAMVSGAIIHGRNRRPFWSEIYETLLAFHLVKPTIATLFQPRKGKFNVTDKGSSLQDTYFDFNIVRPHLICIALVLLGIVVGAVKLAYFPHLFDIQADSFALNTAWASFSLIILIASVSVARETRETRRNIRIPAKLPITVHFDNGHLIDATSQEISMGGLSAQFDQDTLPDHSGWAATHVSLPLEDHTLTLPADMLTMKGGQITMMFHTMDMVQTRQLVRSLMGRADAWIDANNFPRQSAWKAMKDILVIDFLTIKRILRLNFAERADERRAVRERSEAAARWQRASALAHADAPAQPSLDTGPDERSKARSPARRMSGAIAALALVASLGAALILGAGQAAAQTTATDPVQQRARTSEGGAITRELTLRDLQIPAVIRLEGVSGEIGIPFGLSRDEVVTDATLRLWLDWSPAMLGDLSQLVVLVNDEIVRTIRLRPGDAGGRYVDIDVEPALFLPGDNRMNFRLVGHYTRDCEDPFHSALWAAISNRRSSLQLTVQKLAFDPDLSRLPRPFFDPAQNQPLRLPFVFAATPTSGEIEAAASMASWFGALSSYRRFSFPVALGQLPRGNAVVFVRQGRSVAGVDANLSGPFARIMRNPRDPFGQLLVISGATERDLKFAAAAVANANGALSRQQMSLSGATIPQYPAYGAPRWIRTDRPVKLAEIVDPLSLQGQGIRPGPLFVRFRAAPDLFFWPRNGGVLDLNYRYPVASWLDRRASRLDILLNGQFQKTLPLSDTNWLSSLIGNDAARSSERSQDVVLPRYDLYGQNELVMNYDLILSEKRRCVATPPGDVRASILPDSEIDLSGAYHALRMPDLASFASAGYPFTIHPDLARTVAVMSPRPTRSEIEAFLMLMGRFGDSTGAVVSRMRVVQDALAADLDGSDIIAIGNTQDLLANPLFENGPVSRGEGGLTVRGGSALTRVMEGEWPFREDDTRAQNAATRAADFQGILSFESPFTPGRTVVAVLASDPGQLPEMIANMAEPKFNAGIQGDLAIADGTSVESFLVGPTYWVGSLPWWMHIAYWFGGHPLILAIGGLLVAFLLAAPIYLLLKRQARSRLGSEDAE
ncbi:UDP-forming cellulose synthase catalytic subunit [Croceicoccus hydrothermalis]|uniref:UDP-forming cellulose synthase catalytic subunit n=1 Tax=Croceicoccus hydrothermalis TaxID=2867964 RepID=UPI001EFBF9EC|nr:UDP-forming cellulose synthase catalytic subunit [Croceicoccus hydrothermalis]